MKGNKTASPLTVVVERAGNDWYAYAPDLADVVVATGSTQDENLDRFRDALQGLMGYKREEGRPRPQRVWIGNSRNRRRVVPLSSARGILVCAAIAAATVYSAAHVGNSLL